MKRLLDLTASTLGVVALSPVLLIVAAVILMRDGRPIFYVSERMRTHKRPFRLIKFRTMSNAPPATNEGVTGGDKAMRITPTGRILRRFRLDELPQLFNVIWGDMSLVGPRPPLRRYTDMFPEVYEEVLRSKPGITGLATLHFHAHEEALIGKAATAKETEHIYVARCIPRKARLDLIYQKHANICFDVMLIWQTLRRVAGKRH